MLYWFRFTLRLMARAGFSVMVILWIVAQWRVISFHWQKGTIQLLGMSNTDGFAVQWRSGSGATTYPYPVIPDNSPEITLDIPGITCWGSLLNGAVQLDDWVICLLFLGAVFVTRRNDRQETTAPEEVGAAE